MFVSSLSLIISSCLSLILPESQEQASQIITGNVPDFIQNSPAYFTKQHNISLKEIFNNMAPNFNDPNAALGTILASPSKQSPDYYYYWVRDGSVVMRSLLGESSISAQDMKSLFRTFAQLSLKHQANSRGNLGEPKFMADGSLFTGPWGRPQNDGPALRVLAFAAYIKAYGLDDVSNTWYKNDFPASSLIKKDLEFIANEWSKQCFDLWEEIQGTHYYTRNVQQAALQAGAEVARRFGDSNAAKYYDQVAVNIQKDMVRFWDDKNNFLHYAVDIGYDRGKRSFLDTAVILGCLHSHDFPDPHYYCSSDRIMTTAAKILASFQPIYKINKDQKYTLLGRYPEDVYDGVGTSTGNPWILTTHAFAEYLYTIASEIGADLSFGYTVSQSGFEFFSKIVPGVVSGPGKLTEKTQQYLVGNLTLAGDGYMLQVGKFATQGSFPEQINRDTGNLQGARQLTWSHGSFLTALQVRAGISF